MAKKDIFITATNTEVGKTFTTLSLIEAFSKKGYKVGVFKPIETGVFDTPSDAKALLQMCSKFNADFKNITTKDIAPLQFKLPAAPFVAKKNEKIDFDKIKKSYDKIRFLCDIVLIEGAGGLLVPVEDDFFMVDFIDFFDATPLLVTHSKLGCINDTLLSINLLEQRGYAYEWCVNKKDTDTNFENISLPYYKKKFGKVLTVQDDLDLICQSLLIGD